MGTGAHSGQVYAAGRALQQVTTSAGCYTPARSLHLQAAVSGLAPPRPPPTDCPPRLYSLSMTQAQQGSTLPALPMSGLLMGDPLLVFWTFNVNTLEGRISLTEGHFKSYMLHTALNCVAVLRDCIQARFTYLAVDYLVANGLVEQDGIRRIRGRVVIQSSCPKGDSVLDLHIYLHGAGWLSALAKQPVSRPE